MRSIAWSYGKLRGSTHRSRRERLCMSDDMDKKLFRRLSESMQQHDKIARGERSPSRVAIARYDLVEYLESKQAMASFLEACFEEASADNTFIAAALRHIARAYGLAQLAREIGMSTTELAAELQANGGLRLRTFQEIVRAVGCELTVKRQVNPTKEGVRKYMRLRHSRS
jgi:probable addiction module antidote protein